VSAEVSPVTPPTVPSLWFVIAAYNEERAIGDTLAGVRARYPHVVVVDDGSRDGTAEVARRAGAHVVRHPLNLGQGAALQTGIAYALRRRASHIVTFDADGQHDIDDVPAMLQAMRERGADVVLGSRFLGRTSGMPASRRVLLKIAVLFTALTAGIRLTDAHNGLRLLTAAAAARLRITQNGMAHASELIEQIGRARLRYVEVPVHIRYTDYSLEKGQRSSHAFRILGEIISGWLVRW
jgi:polyprenyl-phospho-N-acetylgalactosaminyl synthase